MKQIRSYEFVKFLKTNVLINRSFLFLKTQKYESIKEKIMFGKISNIFQEVIRREACGFPGSVSINEITLEQWPSVGFFCFCRFVKNNLSVVFFVSTYLKYCPSEMTIL